MICWLRPYKPNIFWRHITLATTTALFWSSITKYQPVPPNTDTVPTSNNQYRPLPSSSKYQQEVPSTDSVSPNTKQYLKEYQLAHLFSTWQHIDSHQGSSLTRATCHFSVLNRFLLAEKAGPHGHANKRIYFSNGFPMMVYWGNYHWRYQTYFGLQILYLLWTRWQVCSKPS